MALDLDERRRRQREAAKKLEAAAPVRPAPAPVPPANSPIPSVTGIEAFGQRPTTADTSQVVEIYDPARMTPWVSNARPLQFSFPTDTRYGPVGGRARAVWQTPLFDLRGDIGLQQGFLGNTTVMARETQLDTGYRLHLQIKRQGNATLFPSIADLRVYSQEFGAAVDPGTADFYQQRQDITADVLAFYSGVDVNGTAVSEVILRWNPEGNLRYWGVAVICDYIVAAIIPADTNQVLFSGALH